MTKHVFSRNRLAAATLSIVVALGVPALCMAQQQAQQPKTGEKKRALMLLSVVKVRPDMQTEWEDIQKNEVNPALKKAGVPWRSTWQAAVFGDGTEWVSIYPIDSFAQFDETHPAIRALGPENAARLINKIRRCITESKGFALVHREDLSFMKTGQSEQGLDLAVVTSIRTVPGKGMEFENLVRNEVMPAMKKAEVEAFVVHQTIFGDVNEWIAVTLHRNFADLDRPSPLVRALGEEGVQKLAMKATGVIASMHRSVARRSKDLSFSSPSEQAAVRTPQ